MAPCPINERSAIVDIHVSLVNIGSCIIDPARTVPAVIYNMVVVPVKVHRQPAADCQTETKGQERRYIRRPSLDIDNRRVILRDIHILRLSRNDLDIISIYDDRLLAGAYQVAN